MNDLQKQFIAEARELIQQANDDLIAAEREGFSGERIDRVFRVFHTLKGSAGVVDLPAMGLVLHAAEDVLAAIQAGRLGATSLVIDQALACLDQVATWVDDFEAQEALPLESGEAARKIAGALRSLAGEAGTASEHLTRARPDDDVVPDWARSLIEAQSLQGSAEHESTGSLFALSYEPHAGCFFNGDDPIDLIRRIPKLLVFRADAREQPPTLADLDPFSCNLRLQALSAASHTELSAIFRLVPDQVHIIALPPDALSAKTEGRHDTSAKELVRLVIEEQTQLVSLAKDRPSYISLVGSAIRAAANALRHLRFEDAAERVERAGAAAISQSNPTPLLTALDDVRRLLLDQPISGVDAKRTEASSQGASRPAAARLLRVDEARIDALVDLAGELLVVKNGFVHLAKRIESDASGGDLARALRSQNDALERLAGDLHGALLQLRMVPLAQLFRSFPRLVRDMSQQLGKEVSLVTRGETTESDKTIVDLLFEPVMHLVRNALDHGIETTDQRRVSGKALPATITLSAARMGDRLIVEVSDDGRGIDPAIVRNKARQNGLLPEDELAALSDEQVIELIFSSGFSTASEVTDISGRGVGMDVVRATIDRIGGRVSLKSRVDFGTSVTLDLPMNIALLQIMVVEAGGQLLGIPMDAVSETVRVAPDRISRIKNNDGFRPT